MKFKASCGRGLTDENLRFLASKAFRHPNPMSYVNTDFSNLLISWSQFCKEPLPDRRYLIKSCLKKIGPALILKNK